MGLYVRVKVSKLALFNEGPGLVIVLTRALLGEATWHLG